MEAKFQISLAAARVNAGLTQEDVAKTLGVSKNTIINWEKGKSIPRVTQMQKMCEIYNISEEYIFCPIHQIKFDIKSNRKEE